MRATRERAHQVTARRADWRARVGRLRDAQGGAHAGWAAACPSRDSGMASRSAGLRPAFAGSPNSLPPAACRNPLPLCVSARLTVSTCAVDRPLIAPLLQTLMVGRGFSLWKSHSRTEKRQKGKGKRKKKKGNQGALATRNPTLTSAPSGV
jgi:hypothetical protein